MKKTLFLAALGLFSLAPLAQADVTLHDVDFTVAFPSGNHTTLNLVGQDKVTDYYLSGSQYVGGAKEFLGLYIGNGSGLKFNFTDTVTTKHLYIGSDVKMASTDQDETKAVNHINWSTVNGTSGNFYNGVISVSGDGSWVDVDADYAARINLSGMTNGAVYLNEKGHLTTALASSNCVYATISERDGKHTVVDGYLVSEGTRTLLTGDFSSWDDTENVSISCQGDYEVTADDSGLSVTFTNTSEDLYTGTSGYTHAGAAFFFDEEDGLSIATTVDLTFSNNTDTGNEDVYLSAGVIAMNGDVEIATTGSVSFTGNSTEFSGSAAGAVYSGGAVTIEAAGIELEDNHAYASAGGAISADFGDVTLTATDGGDITISGNTATGTGGAIYSAEGVTISADGAVTISDNASDDNGGAIYAYGDVEITGSTVTISGNNGDNGGAIYSEEGASVTLAATDGDIKVTGNTAASSGGAIFIGGTDAAVTIAAENGNVTFSGNEDAAGANDICFYNDGTLNLSAAEGKTAALEGGVSGRDEAVAVQININGEGESGTVVLGGESNIIHHTVVNGGTLVLKDGAVLGCAPATEPASLQGIATTFGIEGGGYTGSTFVAQEGAVVKYDGTGSAVIYAQAAEITDSTVEGVTINVEEYVKISNSTLTDTQVTGDPANAALVLGDNVTVTLTSLTETTVFDNFSTVSGTVTLDISADTIQAALDAGDSSLEINLFGDQVCIGTEGLTLKFSQTMANILIDSGAGFGFDTGDISEVISISLIAGATSINSYVVNLENVTEIVPEPTTSTLSLLAFAALCARRRRR